MPGWVLPAVAAEMWGVTVEQVLADVATGRLNSRVEGEFIFVDVQSVESSNDADEDDASHATPQTPYRRSLAWSLPGGDVFASSVASAPIVTAEERDALLDDESDDADTAGHIRASSDSEDDDDSDDDPDSDDPADDPPEEPIELTADDIPNWNQVRSRVARTRKPPALRNAA